MDPGSYEDLAGRLYGLLIGLEDRLSSDDASVVYQLIDARHYALALEELARTLAHRQIRITDQERAALTDLVGRVDVLAQAGLIKPQDDLTRALVRAAIEACPPARLPGTAAVATGRPALRRQDPRALRVTHHIQQELAVMRDRSLLSVVRSS